MPTVWKFAGFRVVIYPNDHLPMNVHVIGGGREAIFNIHSSAGPVALRENYGCSPPDLKRIKAELTNNLAELCQAWERIHGPV
jgi:hypothetical protein